VDTTDSFGLNKITQRWMQRHYVVNNFHSRDNINYEAKLPPGKRRITFFGDSFTAGHGIKNVEDRFPNIIRENHHEFEVHVMANNGMESNHELDWIRKLKDFNYSFDIVVLVYTLNDIAYLIPETEEIYHRIYSFRDNLGYFGRNSFFINTMLFRIYALSHPDVMNYYDFVESSYFTEQWDEHAKVLSGMRDLIESDGGRFMVVTFPFYQSRKQEYKFQIVHEKLQEFWNEQSVPHLDLLHIYDQYESSELVVNKFDAHPNEFANIIAASVIEEFIKSNLQR